MDSDYYIKVFGFDETFLTVIALICSVFISVHICFGQNNRKAREYSIMLLLLLLVSTQYYHLGNVASYIPSSRFYIYDSNLMQPACQKSGKGGKRVKDSEEDYDRNPCFCQPSIATCRDKLTNSVINATCPTDNTAYCQYQNNSLTEIPLFIDSNRSCAGGFGPLCTKLQPCYPCDMRSIIAFGTVRCRTCSTDFKGDCNFIPDIGPYCYDSPGSRKVVPCKKCCTDPQPYFLNGTCY